jgi:hypothetical protein
MILVSEAGCRAPPGSVACSTSSLLAVDHDIRIGRIVVRAVEDAVRMAGAPVLGMTLVFGAPLVFRMILVVVMGLAGFFDAMEGGPRLWCTMTFGALRMARCGSAGATPKPLC